jgi:hypothetical protein
MDTTGPSPIIDTPNSHGMFMLGTTTLYLCHMPMFTKQDHRYQVTLQAHLDPASTATYLQDKAQHPGQSYNLINLDTDLFTLPDVANGTVTSYPATVYRGYSNAGGGTPGPEIIARATVSVDRIIRYRPFDQDIPRPAHLTYILFGNGQEAHLDHYIARDPDFQHLLTVAEPPSWLSPSQLRAGVEVAFKLKSEPIPCSSPLVPGTHEVMFEGMANAVQKLRLEDGATTWFSTGNMLNAKDPCAANPASIEATPEGATSLHAALRR